MPFARTDNPTPAALAKRIRRLAEALRLSANLMPNGWLIVDPTTGYADGYKLTAEQALELLERRKAARRR